MKRNYTITLALFLVLSLFCFTNLTAQVRILKLDPATNSVTLKNFGSSNAPISGYWFCVRPAYAQLSNMTTVTSLDPGEELNIASSINFPVASGEFALYNSSSFGSSAAIIDFLQWGTGAANSRESVAVAAGLWVADTFITDAPPFQYNGNGTQNGVANWSTLSVSDIGLSNTFKVFPNPAKKKLNIEFQKVISTGKIEIYDLLGKQVITEIIASNNFLQIDVTALDRGVYLLKISSENGEETKRFIKQ